MSQPFPFDNSYAALPDTFYSRVVPTQVADPKLITINETLAAELGLDASALAQCGDIFAGNRIPDGADPIAQVYAGHQFGGWSPRLGDGRAILLGEVIDSNGLRRDLQLKGSGRTPYSRSGDGRAWLGPVMREYIVSEAMHALGIPTSRALAAVTSGENIQRERVLPGAILTRVASSHIRVGTFQYFAAQQDFKAVQTLCDYVIARHYPGAETALDLLDAVIEAHAKLVARWMSVGFIHGVMNTDNSHIAAETIDYGPCAFMDNFDPRTVYSAIDQFGRYAYQNQPDITVWNMAQLATALLPLIDGDQETAVKKATDAVHRFPDLYQAAWLKTFGAKIGLASPKSEDKELIDAFLAILSTQKLDFTNSFRALSEDPKILSLPEDWQANWQSRLALQKEDPKQIMQSTNPAVIPRNHRVEQAIKAGLAGDYTPFHNLNRILATPFELARADQSYANPPGNDEIVHQTFCGT